MLFKRYHIYPMSVGMKTYTRRNWKVPRASIGGTYPVTHKMIYKPEDIVGYIHVNQLYRQPIGMMTELDAYREGGYDLDTYKDVLIEINDHASNYKPILTTTSLFVVGFTFSLSDTIDPNGGHLMMDEYKKEWEDHMALFKKRKETGTDNLWHEL